MGGGAGDAGEPRVAALVRPLAARGFAATAVPPEGPGTAPARLGGLVAVAPPGGADGAVKAAFPLFRLAALPLRAAASDGGAFLAVVTRMDGAFGFREGSSASVRGLSGLLKTAALEWPGVACRAVDVDPRWKDPAAAADAVAGTVLTRGPLETGLGPAGPCALEAREAPLPVGASSTSLPIAPGEVVVVTGGGRGVTAACARALARAARPTLVLLGRSPAPGEEPAWLRAAADEAAVKRAFLARNPGASPREAEAAWREAAAAREIRSTISDIEAAGAVARYLEADGRDPAAVAAALARVRAENGPVVGLVHGAGVLADAPLDAKTADQVDRVFDTKVGGLRSLLAAAGGDDLRFLVLFSSSTARFGRAGQGDYAAANEALNGAARAEARRRPGCRVVSLDWGPWEGGMVNASLARLFAAEGVGLIPLEAGARQMLAEIAAARPGEAVEAVILAEAAPAPGLASAGAPLEKAFEILVDEERFPVLGSHRIDGRAVVPAALLVEWLAHGALHGNPGLAFHGVEGFRVLKGVTLEGGAPAALRVLAGRASPEGGRRSVPVEIRGGDGAREVLHSRAVVILADRLPGAPPASPVRHHAASPWDPAAAYADVLFHGPALRSLLAVEGVDASGALVRASTAPPPREWIRTPLRGTWIADPMALDAAFQAAILWAERALGAPSLPTGFDRFLQFRRAFPREGVRIALHALEAREHAGRLDVEFTDGAGLLVARMEGFTCVVDASLRSAFRGRGNG